MGRLTRPSLNRPGFTLIELLVVVAIIALLISILLPSLARAREQAKRVQCGSNLGSIGRGCIIYSEANRGAFPTCQYKTSAASSAVSATTVGVSRTMDETAVSRDAGLQYGAGNTRGYFRLLLGGEHAYLRAQQFICPSATKSLLHKSKGGNVRPYVNGVEVRVYDFLGSETESGGTGSASEMGEFSYSFQNTLLGTVGTEVYGTKMKNTQDPRLALAADRNPYSNSITNIQQTDADGVSGSGTYEYSSSTVAQGYDAPPSGPLPSKDSRTTFLDKQANSRNHNRDGQNVAYLDGHAKWSGVALAGADEDCLWGTLEADGAGNPIGNAFPQSGSAYGTMKARSNWHTDSVLIP